MNTIPAPTLILPREEWPDADFDLPEGQPLHAVTDKDDDDDLDWDAEMDLGHTGNVKAQAVVAGMAARSESSKIYSPQVFSIRPPLSVTDLEDDDEDDEGVSTIKVAFLPKPTVKNLPPSIDEDIESAFALPNDLTQLSLAPLSLNHRSSKNSLEWGDKDHTSSSQSSDAYSSLGFADASPSSNSASSVSCAESETDNEDEDDGDLDGLVIPSGLFESGQGGRRLTKILEMKKTQVPDVRAKPTSPDPEDDFEIGLVIDDDVDLSPSRLLHNTQHQQSSRIAYNRSNSVPIRPTSYLRPPSRLRGDRAKSPINPPPSSTRQFQKLRLSPSPPLRSVAPARSQTFQAISSTPPTASSASFLSSKPGSLRGQKSHSGLSGIKPPTPPSAQRKLTRKASLSSLIEANQSYASASGSASSSMGSSKFARYEEPTAASRAKSHKNTTSRLHDYKVPPTRPSTPSSNPAALRLTMPTSSRHKSRPALNAVFPSPPSAFPSRNDSPGLRATSPIPPRPPSKTAVRTIIRPPNNSSMAPKVLRRPKRQRTYGDGTELDGIDDLPTDREKEGRYRVLPKGFGNRVPGGSYPSKSEKGTVRKRGRQEGSDGNNVPLSTSTLKRTIQVEFPTKGFTDSLPKKKKLVSSPTSMTRRKPTLIRNLGGSSAPKIVGDMKWNPQSHRWEGNDHVLRDFDAVVTSTRPALITHLTGSSIGSPVGSFASGARIVGNMIFDPTRMCWISTLPPDEDEPDVFANLADDEDDEGWESKGGTIRASLQLGVSDTSVPSANTSTSTAASGSRMEAPSPARSHTRTMSESESDRGSRASMVCDVDEAFSVACKAVEERHRSEMKGWGTRKSENVFAEPDRSYLYEIRALATRRY